MNSVDNPNFGAASAVGSAQGAEVPLNAVSKRYMAMFALAQIGACVSFIPLLAILLPIKAEELGGADKAQVLALVAFWGSIVAAVANPIAGVVSDRTTWKMGRRRPWMLVGALGTALSYWVIGSSASVFQFLVGFMLFQIFFNLLWSPLNALLPDNVPDQQKGVVSGFLGLGTPIGGALGALLVGQYLTVSDERYAAIAIMLLLAVIPFALMTHDRPADRARMQPLKLQSFFSQFWISPRKHPDFAWAWATRFFVLVAYTVVTNFMFFYLQDAVGYTTIFPGSRVEEGVATLTAIGSIVSVIATVGGGALSDRFARRKIFVAGGAVLMACAILIFALMPTWTGMIFGYVLFGLGTGCFFAVDAALMSQVLPSKDSVGKDLGILNLTNTLAQAAAPILAVQALAFSFGSYQLLFGIAAAIGLIGALALIPIKSVP